jgi:hypothetical protein
MLKRHGVSDPLDQVLKLLGEEIEITAEEAASPMIKNLLAADYQLEPAEGGKLVLKPKLGLRLKAWLELSGFFHAKLRTSEVHGSTEQNITIKINRMTDDVGPRPIEALPAMLIEGGAINES